MIILTNSLAEKVDEGALKVATSLIKRIKKAHSDVTIISYGHQTENADICLSVNKLLLNKALIKTIWQKKELVLYFPFPARTLANSIRTWILSRYARYGLKVCFVQQYSINKLAKFLLRHSGAEIITLSKQAYEFYIDVVGKHVTYLKAGIDSEKFVPVGKDIKHQLQKKYNVCSGKKVVLHVGHLSEGRNIRQLLKVGPEYHVFIVVSTLTKDKWDEQLRTDLMNRPNTTIIDEYIPNIEEIYQMADVYFFPVQEFGHCIDVPLSALEAAACNLPIVTTPFGELKELLGREGFYQIESFEAEFLNDLLQIACTEKKNTRESVLEYDWNLAVNALIK